MLKEIRQLLEEQGPLETAALARQLQAEESALQGMLVFLEQRGQIRRIEMACGGGCMGCGLKKSTCADSSLAALTFWSTGGAGMNGKGAI